MSSSSLIDNGTLSRLYALVLCGGRSSRMGIDKCIIEYHNKPQCYYLYEMMELFCEKVFISCRIEQNDNFLNRYSTLADLPVYNDIGPMGALLTAFDKYPGRNFIMIGCDYPFLTATDIRNFLTSIKDAGAAAFFNDTSRLYEPMLAYYNNRSATFLLEMYRDKDYSLQQFLLKQNAIRYHPENILSVKSADTPAEYDAAIELLKRQG